MYRAGADKGMEKRTDETTNETRLNRVGQETI